MKINTPTECPSCGSKLVLVKDQLFCKNSKCEAQSVKKIEHFCKSVKMKGFGPSALEKLDLESIVDLFRFSEFTFKDKLGDTIGVKLFKEVRRAEKEATLASIIAGLSIPLVGDTAAAKLCTKVTSLKDINATVCKDVGLGEKATSNILEFLNSEEYLDLEPILSKFKNIPSTKFSTSNGKVVCITGKLDNFKNRSEAAEFLQTLGFTVVDSVTKATDILINEEDRPSSKLTKALSLGIRVTTIKDLEKEIN